MEHVEVQEEKVPKIGLGTWQLTGKRCRKAVKNALDIGYRHIDTAQAYGNEEKVGKGIKSSKVDREDIWLTTKIWRDNLTEEKALKSVNKSLERLETNYIDLLLIHWPSEKVAFNETLEAMNQLVDKGAVKNIGVSNFTVEQLEKAQEVSRNPIFANQVEYHPFLDQGELLEKCREDDIMLTAYSPLARGDVLQNETLIGIAAKHDKSAAQVALRWLVEQENVSAIPKASTHQHQADNLNVSDFSLTKDERQKISELAAGKRKVDPAFSPWK